MTFGNSFSSNFVIGSCLHVHIHCLERWQRVSIENNNLMKAIRCQICGSPYIYHSWINLYARSLMYYLIFNIDTAIKSVFAWASSLTWEPLKLLIHTCLLLITIPWGNIHLGKGMALSWLGYQFPPKLALTCSTDDHTHTLFGITEGAILVASDSVPESSIFHKAIVLVLEHSSVNGSRGVIINKHNIPEDLDRRYSYHA